jgi:type IV secretory pathway VirJ component
VHAGSSDRSKQLRASWSATALLCFALPVHALETLAHGRFADVRIFLPRNDTREIVLFLSDADGWTAEETSLSLALAGEGALVAGIDLKQFERELERDGGSCVYPDGDLENLSHFIQAYYKLPGYRAPLLAGIGEGAAFAYAVLAQSAPGIFGAALSMDFCPRLLLEKPLCAGSMLHSTKASEGGGAELAPASELQAPWMILRASDDPACALASVRSFVAEVPSAQLILRSGRGGDFAAEEGVALARSAYERLSQNPAPNLPIVPGDLSDLPLVEVPPHGKVDAMALFISARCAISGRRARRTASRPMSTAPCAITWRIGTKAMPFSSGTRRARTCCLSSSIVSRMRRAASSHSSR